jgi:tetratricopeptide (TPR) repeat protein
MEKRIYLKQEEIKLGVGSTAKATIIENYYQVVEKDEDHVEIQLLDFRDKLLGEPSVVPKEKLKDYIYCPDYFESKKSLKEVLIEKHVRSGDEHFQKKEYFSAEYEYNQVLSVDENHLKANLGKGKTLYARGEKEEAKKIFSKISNIENLYDVENKHVFNEFGIELRKRGLFEEANMNYLKAISIDPKDEVLYYNLGRAYYEQGHYTKAVEQLKLALKIKPEFKEAQEFLSKIECTKQEYPDTQPI